MSTTGNWITSTTSAQFEQDVIERSYRLPVVVDFWAPWCNPCRVLGPLLEKIAREKNGAFVLVKVNTDECPDLAMALGIQGVPAVFAVREGQIVNHFVGAMPEPQLRQWIEGILPREDERLVAEADTVAGQDPTAAEAKYRQALAINPKSTSALLGLVKLLVRQSRFEEAKPFLQELRDLGAIGEEVERRQAEIALTSGSSAGDDLAELRQQVEANPGDSGARLKLAKALAAHSRYPEALEQALAVVQFQPGEPREEARKFMIQIFNLLGSDHPITQEYRRRLTMALF